MKWFIPHTDNNKDAERVYASIKKHVAGVLGIDSFSSRRIWKLTFRDKGKLLDAEVGKRLYMREIRDEVIAILYEPRRNLYHICTPSRGGLRDMSVLVGSDEVTSVVDFDPE